MGREFRYPLYAAVDESRGNLLALEGAFGQKVFRSEQTARGIAKRRGGRVVRIDPVE